MSDVSTAERARRRARRQRQRRDAIERLEAARAVPAPVAHDQTTRLEQLLVRALYTAALDWPTADLAELVDGLAEDGWEDADLDQLECLLESEHADRHA